MLTIASPEDFDLRLTIADWSRKGKNQKALLLKESTS